MKTSKILSILLISVVILFGCKDNENQDSTPPGSLTIENITPTNGGGIISYQLPDDSDILFVRDIVVHKMNEIRNYQIKNDLEISNIKYVRDVSECSQTYHEEVFSEMTDIDETELNKRYEIGKSLLGDLNELYKDNCVTKKSFFLNSSSFSTATLLLGSSGSID